MTKKSLIDWMKRRKARYGTWTAFAEALDIPKQTLNAVVQGDREPPPSLLAKLGMTKTTVYVESKEKR